MNWRVAALTAAALTGFAANSVLCRMALRPGLVDATTFTGVRLVSGALVLAVLARAFSRPAGAPRGGSWASAAALFAYAAAFSYAYLRISAGVGALLLFGAVQITMLAAALRAGERPRGPEAAGWVVAAGGLVALLSPGITAPDPRGAALMVAAGAAWGIYSLRGRSASSPLAATGENFLCSLPLAIGLVALGAVRASLHATPRGIALAVLSGAIASGVGYSLWYAALPTLGATRAAIVQLLVPVLVAAAGVALLGEPVTRRLVLSALAVLGGVALATSAGGRRSR